MLKIGDGRVLKHQLPGAFRRSGIKHQTQMRKRMCMLRDVMATPIHRRPGIAYTDGRICLANYPQILLKHRHRSLVDEIEFLKACQVFTVVRRKSVLLDVLRTAGTSTAVPGVADQTRIRKVFHQLHAFFVKTIRQHIRTRVIIHRDDRVTECLKYLTHLNFPPDATNPPPDHLYDDLSRRDIRHLPVIGGRHP